MSNLDLFPNSHVPAKLKQIFAEAGIEATRQGSVPWRKIPYILYNKRLYISGLPTTVFFTSDKPSDQEKDKRLNDHLKWPPSGISNALKALETACAMDGRIKLQPRPPGRDVVFEMVSEDGTKFDLGKWKIPEPEVLPKPLSFSATRTIKPIASTKTKNTRTRPFDILISSNTLPASTAETKVIQKTTSRKDQPTKSVFTSSSVTKTLCAPFPGSRNIPLKLRKMLYALGVKESNTHPGRIAWTTLPHVLWRRGRYITGIPAIFVINAKNPGLEHIERKMRMAFAPSTTETALATLDAALRRGQVKILKRPKGRDVVFEIVTTGGLYDLGKWKDKGIKPPPENEARRFSNPFNFWPNFPPKPLAQLYPPDSPLKPFDPRIKPTTTPLVLPSYHKVSSGLSMADSANASMPSAIWKYNQMIGSSSSGSGDAAVALVAPVSVALDSIDTADVPFCRNVNVPTLLRHRLGRMRHIDWGNSLISTPKFAGVREGPTKPDAIPWANVLWPGGKYITNLPREFVLGKETPEEAILKPWQPHGMFNADPVVAQTPVDGIINKTARVMDREAGGNVAFEVVDANGGTVDIGTWEDPKPTFKGNIKTNDEESEKKESIPPQRAWVEEVNNVVDQLAEQLVENGVELPPHPKREGRYKIPWPELPGLLYAAQKTLGGLPLRMLPFWRAQGRLSGRWVVRWNRQSVDRLNTLLDCDAIYIEDWTLEKIIVQAHDDDNTTYGFTLDDFLNAERDDPERLVHNGVVQPPLTFGVLNARRRAASSETGNERAPKRRKSQHQPKESGSSVNVPEIPWGDVSENLCTNGPEIEANPASSTIVRRRTKFMSDIPLNSNIYWEQPFDPKLSISERNAQSRWQKEILKELIALLIYYEIPCIAPEHERLAYFLPWSNLPRYLAARGLCLVGLPSVCVPHVEDNVVTAEVGPAVWEKFQWEALEQALKRGQISVKKASRRMLFELVSDDGKKEPSAVGFTKDWLRMNVGVEAGQPTSIMASTVAPLDPILNETEDEDEASTSDMSIDD